MVALDVQAQQFSQVWGWRIRIGTLFSADVSPVPFQYVKATVVRGNIHTAGGVYQSVLSNIQWKHTEMNSPFIKQLQKMMKNDNIDSDKLSIRLNMLSFNNLIHSSNFTTGPVSGRVL